MIRYSITEAELRRRIVRESPTWLERAQARTQELIDLGRYEDGPPSWSDIKAVYMDLQHDKCAYCERQLESRQFGKIEHDVEHFRPKAAVDRWPTHKEAERGIRYEFATGDAHPPGYHRLAYHPLNYATACKPCNSSRKDNYFPIAGDRVSAGDAPRDYRGEKPYLVYPLGNTGFDPEKLITFDGVIAIPLYRSGHRHRVARVTIDFFALNERERLREERARVIQLLYLAHAHLQDAHETLKRAARRAIAYQTSERAPHTSCARAYEATLERDLDRARKLYEGAVSYLPE